MVFLNPNSCKGLEPIQRQGRERIMTQTVAKDKVDGCIRSLGLRQTFPGTPQGHRQLVALLRKRKVEQGRHGGQRRL